MGTVRTYLGKWGEKWISATPMPKFWEKGGERREKWCDGWGERKRNFGNDIAEIGRLKKKKKLNCGKSNATAIRYFTIFFKNCYYGQFFTGSH